MTQRVDVDLESEKVFFDGAWAGRAELSGRISQMMASGDFKIGRLASALEALDLAVATARVVQFKLSAENYAKLEAAGQKLGKNAAEFARDLLVQVLGTAAAMPAPAQAPMMAPPAMSTPVIAGGPATIPMMSTPDVTPEEAAGALTMKPKVRDPMAGPTTSPGMAPVAAAPGQPQPNVVVDLGNPEDPGRPKPGDRRWFNR